MESLTSNTLAGAGSFRCEECGTVVELQSRDALAACPQCGSRSFQRASLFAAGRFARRAVPTRDERAELVAEAREQLHGAAAGGHLAFRDGAVLRTVALRGEHTRIGRSLTADLRFDDSTVSRRHALLVAAADGVRVMDDRSLNGVFVNGNRVEGAHLLADEDELLVGRHRLVFLTVATSPLDLPAPAAQA